MLGESPCTSIIYVFTFRLFFANPITAAAYSYYKIICSIHVYRAIFKVRLRYNVYTPYSLIRDLLSIFTPFLYLQYEDLDPHRRVLYAILLHQKPS